VRDLPIWTKLGLIMIVPTLATIIVGTVGLLDQVEQASNADRARALAVLSGDGGNLVHALQDERAAVIQLLSAPPSDTERLKAEYATRQQGTDTANARYRLSRSTLADIPENLRVLLDRVETQLGELPVLRSQVSNVSEVPLTTAERQYRILIDDLLTIPDVAAQLTGDTTLADRMRAAAAVAAAKEFLAQERGVVLQALANGNISQAVRRDYIATQKGQELALLSFTAVNTPEQQEFFERTVTGPEVRAALEFEGKLDTLRPDQNPNEVVDPAAWDRAMVGRANLLNEVEIELNQQAQDAAIALGSSVQRRVLLETGLLLLTLLIGILFAWLVARSMARSLRDLRQGALAVAQYGLPQAVARLRDPALSSNMSPQGMALQIAEPLPVRSKDEFGQVTEAFNAVHLEAVRTAAEQAALRASVATMFVNLARRSQILVDRLIGHLDRLERGEQDPDRLSALFQLDHLATRMRRNDENLLVLAGADSTRIQREPAALMDVLRAAQSEVEHYTRIDFTGIDGDIEIAAHAVNDLVHLVAELFDNATAFSAPDTTIAVEGRRVGDRGVLLVEDRGIGMSPDQYAELNERLATPPMVDVAVSRMMGLVVVARLAARHGVKVELRPAPERGTVAEVHLPSGVLVPRALAGRSHAPVGFPAAKPLGTPAPAPAPASNHLHFPPPLALESGPSAWTDESRAASLQPPTSTPGFGQPPSHYASPPSPAPAFGGPPSGQPGGYPGAGEPPGRAGSLGAAAAFGGAAGLGAAAAYGGAAGGLGAAAAGLGGAAGNVGGHLGAGSGSSTNGANGGRGLPAWADLTGVTPSDTPPSSGGPSDLDPLPQRRPGNQWGDQPSDQPIPRQPGSPDAWGRGPAAPGTPGGPPAAAASTLPTLPTGFAGPGGPPNFGAPGMPPGFAADYPGVGAPSGPSGPPPTHPPLWPPVAEPAEPVPGIPDRLSSSLDMTSDPRMRGDVAAGMTSDFPSRFANDMTVELPIFSELESAWFRAGEVPAPARPAAWPPEPTAPPAPATAPAPAPRPATSEWPGGVDAATRSGGAAAAPSEVSWRTIADDGWRAAEAALEPQDGGTTEMGLPRRVPMAQLVPGGVEVAATTERRTPEAVRGLLSAYTRGVQKGRGAHGRDDSDQSDTSPTSGKEQDA
jgi:signal transduction histidine kinase